MELNTLLHEAKIWHGSQTSAQPETVTTGISQLDDALTGKGWPSGALTEIIAASNISGALQLLLPALARLSQSNRWIALIAPPHIPYPTTLRIQGVDLSRLLIVHTKAEQTLWATEQALRSGTCGAVITWPEEIDDRDVRRLQLAAEQGGAAGFIFQEETLSTQSPAALRMLMENTANGLRVHITKRRGGWASMPITVHHTNIQNYSSAA